MSRATLRRPFAPLGIPNYRRFVAGQLVSLTGTWVQTVAELWLVLQLTGSAVSLGLTTALQFGPMLVIGAFAGLLADRLPKRRILILTQIGMAVPALSLFGLTAAGAAELWMVYLLILLRGAGVAVDHPVRQAFVMEMVGPRHVAGAVSLNAALVSCARLVGPGIGGVIIALAGVAPCFALNAASFAAVIWALAAMDPAALSPAAPVGRARGQLRSAVRYVRATSALLLPLVVMAVVSTLAFNFRVLLPVLASDTFAAGAATYGALGAAMGAGAVAGALANGGRRRSPTQRDLGVLAIAFGVLLLAVAAAPSVTAAIVVLVPLGAVSTAFAATTNALLQLAVAPGMRGRVMALYSVVFLGSTPIGGPLVGWVAEHAGARAGFALGAVATIAAGAVALAAAARGNRCEPARPRPRTRGATRAAGSLRAWRSNRSWTGTAGESATSGSRSPTAATSAASTACPRTASPGSSARSS